MQAFLNAFKSKTMLASLATVILSNLVQPVQDFIVAHPGKSGTIVGAVFAVLRMVTTQPLTTKA